MERQQADNLLKSHSSGTYLIRERTAEAERFAISIKLVFDIPGEGEGKSSGMVFTDMGFKGNKSSHGRPRQPFPCIL